LCSALKPEPARASIHGRHRSTMRLALGGGGMPVIDSRASSETTSARDGEAVVLAGVAMDNVGITASVALVDVLYDSTRSAAAVLPIGNMSEEEGTFTNLRGRVQRFMQAKAPPGLARPSWSAVADLLLALGDGTNFFTASEVFDSLARERKEFSGLSYDTLGMGGAQINNGRRQ
jgi:NADH-quinone oxidoreductase subunit G